MPAFVTNLGFPAMVLILLMIIGIGLLIFFLTKKK